MMDALQPHIRPMELPAKRAIPVLIPSYNGARKIANLVPLLALLLAREDVQVVVLSVHQELARVGTFEILEALGHRCVATIDDAEERLDAVKLACVPVSVLSPDLAKLIDVRMAIGVRNSGHTLAKLMVPNGIGAGAPVPLIPRP